MNKYVPLSCHTHYSLLRGFSKPKELAEHCAKHEIPAIAITDYNSLSGVVSFYEACKSKGIKSILGSKLDITGVGQLKVLSMNLNGWQELLKVYHSRDISDILNSKNLIVTFGDSGSFIDKATNANYTVDLLRESLKDRLFCEIQGLGHSDQVKLAKMSQFSKIIKTIATPNIHYIDEISRKDHQLLLCSHMKTTLKDSKQSKEYDEFEHFFDDTANFKFPSYEEMGQFGIKEEWLKNTLELSDMIENYSILDKPKLPKYEWTDGLSEDEYLKKLCREGFQKRFAGKDINREEYGERAKREFEVIFKAGLSGYFLIVQDYVNWAKSQGYLTGPGRGSAAGCLISYMLGITNIDPIKYGLIFERFYNDGRNTKDNISMPDIDTDFQIDAREHVVNYIRNRYGEDRVGQVATFGSLKGRGALKEVLRVHQACDDATMNKITKVFPNEAEIQDELEEQKENSIIRWTLYNRPESVSEYCEINDKDELVGDYASFFAQAIRLEGTYKSYGKHASALVIGYKPLKEICPMIREKSGNNDIAFVEYEYLEKMTVNKFDLLGVAAFNKLSGINSLLRKNYIERKEEEEDVEI